jgi:flagellin-like hook-associated protein FlgL
VTFNGNFESQSVTVNNQQVPISTSLQAAFNVDSADGSPSVFQTLINLADTLANGTVVDQSATAINTPGQTIQGAGAAAPSTLANAPFAVPIVADSTGNVSISINNAGPNGTQHVQTYTFAVSPPAAPPATAIDDGTAASIVGQINANAGVTGLSATFDAKTQRLILTNASGGSFSVTDVPSPGATNTGNFTSVFGLTGQADVESTISTQIGDIQNALNVTLNARAVLGSQLNTLSSLGSQNSTNVVDTTQQESQIEDVDVAKATSQFTQTQTALDAAFATTTRLEGKTLFDFLSG